MGHTPGPWEVLDNEDTDPWTIAAKGRRDRLDTIAEVTYTGGFAEGDAHLIAAAPDLLAALEEIKVMSDQAIVRRRAAAAIRRAKEGM